MADARVPPDDRMASASAGADPGRLPLTELIGDKDAERVERAFGYTSAGQLAGHLPRRYAERGELGGLDHLEDGIHLTVVARVVSVSSRPMRQRRGTITEARITDGRGEVVLTWFNQAWRAEKLLAGVSGMFSGQVKRTKYGFQLTHPDFQLFDDERPVGEEALRWQQRLIPIYPATGALPSWEVGKIIDRLLGRLPQLPDPVPAELRRARGELDYDTALRTAHHPASRAELDVAIDSLKFSEALALQAALAQQRAFTSLVAAKARPLRPGGVLDRFTQHSRFTLTPDQHSVGETISDEIAGDRPMHRLLQGEVGSGKTLVAIRAMLQVAETGGQSALLAPTEVLAAQHLRSIVAELGPDLAAELMPTLVTGSQTKRERQSALLRVVTGEAKIVVGTHALLGDTVTFDDLGLVVVDEQHRFGVEQRERLRRKGRTAPHVLVLTATPIPRTVAMTVFGDLDVSTLRTMPTGRAGITTVVVALAEHPAWVARIWERIGEEVAAGRQAFIVCPAIEPGEVEASDQGEGGADAFADSIDDAMGASESAAAGWPVATVAEILEVVRAHPALAGRRVEALHGSLRPDQKDAVMSAFARGEVDVVVATTVIEVGVNVPNASVMAVLDADRFGMSQLHQLRGRVGRGEWPGLCLLATRAPAGSLARERVDAVAGTLDGFVLAERDLELRREGDVLGSAQSGGASSLRVLRVTRDGDIIEAAREAAIAILANDPALEHHPYLRLQLEGIGRSARDHLEMG